MDHESLSIAGLLTGLAALVAAFAPHLWGWLKAREEARGKVAEATKSADAVVAAKSADVGGIVAQQMTAFMNAMSQRITTLENNEKDLRASMTTRETEAEQREQALVERVEQVESENEECRRNYDTLTRDYDEIKKENVELRREMGELREDKARLLRANNAISQELHTLRNDIQTFKSTPALGTKKIGGNE